MVTMTTTSDILSGGASMSPRSLQKAVAEQARRGPALAAALAPVLAAQKRKLPESVSAPAVGGEITPEHRLLLRSTMGFNQAELEWVRSLGYYRYLDLQVELLLDDGPLEEVLAELLPTIHLEPAELLRSYRGDPQTPVIELLLATVLRSLYSPRQLYERMTVFWTDHFNIYLFDDNQYLFKGTDHREVVRRHAMGTFPELLSASAHSPAMLIYLTNDSNVAGHPNENYARELMELHTLGADNGYTQEDVKEVARCFTGWTVSRGQRGTVPGRFVFEPELHDTGEKTVLGHRIPAGGGIEDGERVLEILAGHPNTARFISTKLLRYFLTYDPPEPWIDLLTQTYLDTGGDIKRMLREVLKGRWIERADPKLKRPYHLAVSSLRGLGAEVGNPFFLISSLLAMGQLPYNWAPPNGYPDSDGYWSGYLLPRWTYGEQVMTARGGQLRLDVPLLQGELSPQQLIQRMDWLLFNQTLPLTARRTIIRHLEELPAGETRTRAGLALAFAAPQFQEY